MLGTSMSPYVCLWQNYVQLYFTQDGALPPSRIPFMRGLTTFLLVGGLGVEKKSCPRNPDVIPCSLLLGVVRKDEICQSQPRTVHELEQKFKIIYPGSSGHLKVNC
jgi:hypothetical protein